MEDQRPKTWEHITWEHITQVQNFIDICIKELYMRGVQHDQSKLESPEREIFDKYTQKLRDTTYGSVEYNQYLKEMKPALDHHYAKNRHHPEHNSYYECNGCFKRFYQDDIPHSCDVCGYSQFQSRPDISKMNLIDIMEMLCDWKAATMRHADGDIRKSIEMNQKRFEYSDELKEIFLNTIDIMENK